MTTQTDLNTNIVSRTENKETGQLLVAKLDKLSSAIYLVTDFMTDGEPLKWRLRDLSLRLLERVSDSRHGNDLLTHFLLNNITSEINKIVSLLSVGINSSNVSKMNLSILKKEFESILNTITNYEELPSNIESLPVNSLSGEYKKIEPEKSNKDLYAETHKDVPERKILETKGQIAKPINKIEKVVVSDKKNDRQEMILKYIKDHGWSSIADISSVDTGCSLKTIQRELSALVSKNVLKKKGDRRWSRYQIA